MAELSKQNINIMQEVEDPHMKAVFIKRKNWVNMVWQARQCIEIHFLTVFVLQAWEEGTDMSTRLVIIQLIGSSAAQVIDQLCCIKHNYLSKHDETHFSSWLFYLVKRAKKKRQTTVTKPKLNASIRG